MFQNICSIVFLFYLFVLIWRLLYLLVEPYATLILDDDEELHGKSHDSRIGPCPSRDPLRTCQNDLKTNEQREPNGDGLNFRIIKIEKMRLGPCAHKSVKSLELQSWQKHFSSHTGIIVISIISSSSYYKSTVRKRPFSNLSMTVTLLHIFPVKLFILSIHSLTEFF